MTFGVSRSENFLHSLKGAISKKYKLGFSCERKGVFFILYSAAKAVYVERKGNRDDMQRSAHFQADQRSSNIFEENISSIDTHI